MTLDSNINKYVGNIFASQSIQEHIPSGSNVYGCFVQDCYNPSYGGHRPTAYIDKDNYVFVYSDIGLSSAIVSLTIIVK